MMLSKVSIDDLLWIGKYKCAWLLSFNAISTVASQVRRVDIVTSYTIIKGDADAFRTRTPFVCPSPRNLRLP
ncbi:hypothetical protein D3C86_2050060 [compost metagenome]